MDKPFSGKLALVTGASRGIGAATAEALGAAGAHVILTARTAGGLEEVEERIHAAGGSATIAPLDLAENDSIARLAEAIGGRWQALDILVLNAAMLGTLAPVPAIDAKEFARLLTLNIMAQQQLIAAFDPLLRASTAGRVIGLTSTVAQAPRAYWGAYGASKAALETLLLAYAEEVGKISAIRVAVVNPGATATAMRQKAYPGEDQATLKSPAVVGAALAKLIEQGFETGLRTTIEG
ncbi:SDR family NAD(P)-dependent oxidoreductase [Sphingomonas histidinilytica]|jgi:short-subunit dehydrogenase|uniref:Short-chain dehydrogenase n=1 Tax=Rhizorhabdus histidinilytica TaxID=439228 RepID=A0A1T5F5E2_9SPHN|nr:SDR family NAD(P)-dependent oxidoreductase [Rhizorhabdus histidinilytica]MBO9379576.1 SDR family NAD(P)-dependent oxidoreductase [Rhizorhabdus histidinilytica]QEH77995.1 SDR family NAD(P)-dependent oxidoreductase [Sphingomonas sp. C8-2]SKB91427.1 Short-chain dehydrogenase [Rhizorhabdus histidinilytica]